MVKKRKKKIKKKEIIDRTDAPIAINYEQNENKTLEIIKSWGYGIIGIVVILSIFSGFKYPWKWIDALYVTENEKIEIIAENWDSAYYPLIEWCAKKSDLDKSSKFSKFKGKARLKDSKSYIISLSGNEKRCLEDKKFRIELINFPIKEVKENEILNRWFNEIPPHIKNFDFIIEENTNYKTEKFIIETNLFYSWDSIKSLEDDDFSLYHDIQTICAYSENIGYKDDWCRDSSLLYSDNDDQDPRKKVFSIDFLTQKDFILLGKGCFNGCIANITYVTELGKNNIRGLEIIKPNLKTWPKYSDKNNKKIVEYNSLINKTYYTVNELEKNYSKPEWFVNIEIQ